MHPLLEGLNEAQTTAVIHRGGPLLIVAGAGTGKTTVLTRRYSYLLQEEHLSTDEILALTFTDKAAGEMEDRVLKLLSTGAYDFWISTFHGFCQRVLEEHGIEIGLPNQFRLLTPTDAWLLLRRHMSELPLDHYRPLGHPARFLRSLLQHISRAKDEGITAEQYQAFVQQFQMEGDEEAVLGEKKRLQELADLYQAYRHIMREEGCLDFGDLILEALRLFRERPAVLEKYRAQFKYLMVDEFQDTNWAQYELIKLLAGTRREITVVGDDDQAIYKFRGASLANILQFRDDFPQATTVALTQNYRSYGEILTTAYGFIEHNNPHRLEIQLKDTGLSKRLEAMRGVGGEVRVLWKRTVEEEVEAVMEDIQARKQRDPEMTWNDVAVLIRSNDSAEPFIRGFERYSIPFQFMALRGLYLTPVVLDVVALLTVAIAPQDSLHLWRVLSGGGYCLTARDLANLSQYTNFKGVPLWWGVQDASRGPETGVSEEGRAICERLVRDGDGLGEMARRARPFEVFQTGLEKSGYLELLMKKPEGEKREALQHLNTFAQRIKRYEHATHDPTVRGFLEELRLEIESGEEGALEHDPDSGPELVKILTVHAAKGLEYKYVYVVSLVDQRFPTRERGEAIALPDGLVQERLTEGDVHLEEERRLFYVALTRAKDTLVLSGASEYGGARAKKPSLFFTELGVEISPLECAKEERDAMRALQRKATMNVPEEHPRLYYALKHKFSFTQLAAFRRCPMQYKFAHIYRVPVLGSSQRSFGQSIHLTLQRVLDMHVLRTREGQARLFEEIPMFEAGAFSVTEEEALQMLEEAWIDEWYTDRPTHDRRLNEAKQLVQRFIVSCQVRVPNVYELEKEFTLVLGTHSMKGKIDRVDRLPNGHLEVLDYKTGHMKKKLEAEDKEQLYVYQLALEERGHVVDRLAYVYLSDGASLEVDLLQGKERAAFIEKLTKRMDEIMLSDYLPAPDRMTCVHCDFMKICEFKKL